MNRTSPRGPHRPRAGDSTTIRFSAGTDSLDPGVGTTLPAGRYELVAILPIHGDGTREQIATSPVAIEIVGDRTG